MKKPITSWHKSKMLAWEFLGTLVFSYGICSSVDNLTVSTALLAGLLLTVPFSGGHLNPAVSFAFAMKGTITFFEFSFRVIG